MDERKKPRADRVPNKAPRAPSQPSTARAARGTGRRKKKKSGGFSIFVLLRTAVAVIILLVLLVVFFKTRGRRDDPAQPVASSAPERGEQAKPAFVMPLPRGSGVHPEPIKLFKPGPGNGPEPIRRNPQVSDKFDYVYGGEHLEQFFYADADALGLRNADEFARRMEQQTRKVEQLTTSLGPNHFRVKTAVLVRDYLRTLARLAPEQRGRLQQAADTVNAAANLMTPGGENRDTTANMTQIRTLLEQAFQIRREVLGEECPRNISVLLGLLFFLERGSGLDYASSSAQNKIYTLKVTEIAAKSFGPDHPVYASCLLRRGGLHRLSRQYAEAEADYLKALEIDQKTTGEASIDRVNLLNGLAVLYEKMGDEVKAEKILQASAETASKFSGMGSDPRILSVVALKRLGRVYRERGEYAKAEPYFQKALEIEKSKGSNSSGYVLALSVFGEFLQKKGDLAGAEESARKAVEIAEQHLGADHGALRTALETLGTIYAAQGKGREAEERYLRVLQVTPNFLPTEVLLAELYTQQKEFARAEPLVRKLLIMVPQLSGEYHAAYVKTLGMAAAITRDRRDFVYAQEYGKTALEIILKHLEKISVAQSERGQFALMRVNRAHFDTFVHDAGQNARSDAASAYKFVLAWKGAVTARQRLARFARTGLTDADQATKDLFAELDKTARELARLSQQPLEGVKDAKGGSNLKELEQTYERLEIELSAKTEAFRRLRQSKQLTPADLQKSLPAGAALVDFVTYSRPAANGAASDHLAAFVLTPTKIRRVELGELDSVTPAIDAFLRKTARVKPVLGPDDPALVLRDRLWKPLTEHLKGASVVLVAPEGPLCRLPFGMLPSADGQRFLIEEKAVAVIPVPQLLPELLATPARKLKDAPALLALGNANFDGLLPAAAQKPDPKAPPLSSTGERALTGVQWTSLPGTLGEIESIEGTFRKAVPQGKLTVLRGDDASELSVRKHAPAHRFLHLATHGFFLPREAQAPNQHPGLLSGLVLAGANKPRPTGDDGVLTALEVSELDLTGVDLAVLSACETGLGEVAGGEGVLGLQRAFQVAGTRATVTSLWKVSDDATRRLMERFYQNYWDKKMGALEALRQAQIWMLKEAPAAGTARVDDRGIIRVDDTPAPAGDRRCSPYLWAAFVLSGDWR